MTINYTTLLGLAKPVTGTESGTWGDVVNDQITSLVEDAIANAASLNVTSGNVTLTDNNGSSDQARMAILLVTGTPGVSRNIVAPSTSKWYIVKNGSNAEVVLKGSATTGVTIPAGVEALAFWNGSDFELTSMVGPSSSTDNAITRYDGTTGKVVQNSGVTIDDSNNMTGVVALTATGNINFDGGTFVFNDSGADKDFRVEGDTDANLLFTDASTDRVGIGTSSPGAKLNVEVTGSGNFTSLLLSRTTGSIDQEQSIVWQQNDLSNLAGAAIAGSFESATSGSLRFKTTLSSSLTERMRIEPDGDVGIGTSAPATKLQVVGIVASTGSGTSIFAAGEVSTYTLTGITSPNYGIAYGVLTGRTNPALTVSGFDAIAFGTNQAERMRIDSSGNLGIGATSPSGKLDVVGSGGTFRVGTAGDSISFTKGGTNYIGTSTAGGQLLFQTGAGADRMIIESDGDVGIGTNSPVSKLEVNGGYITSGSATATAGAKLLAGSYSDGHLTTLGSEYGSGGAVLAYAVWPSTTVGGAFTSATGITIGRAAYIQDGGTHRWFTGSSQTVSIGSAVSMSERARITSGGYFKASNNATYVASGNDFHEFNTNAADVVLWARNTNASPFGYYVDFTNDPNNASNYVFKAATGATNIYTIWSNGTVSARSDVRLKKNIETARNGYAEDLAKLRVVKYNWYNHEEGTPKELGFIAQEVEQVFPGLVITDKPGEENESKSIKTSVLVPMLVKAIQELKTELDSVKAELAALKGA